MNNPDHKYWHTTGALLHLPGFGPKKVSTLRDQGIESWEMLLHEFHQDLPGLSGIAPAWVQAIYETEAALRAGEIGSLVARLHRSDQWRILADFFERATFLDIETSGDELRPEITVMVVKHQGKLRTFTSGQNLNDFLHLMDEVSLLVTFNGASFDVPQIENHFHIPLTDLPHIDLRWVCYHADLKGGLKEIERLVGLVRPDDLIGVDGAEADWLWRRWKETANPVMLQRLIRYCAADVVGLEHLARRVIARQAGASFPEYDWAELPAE